MSLIDDLTAGARMPCAGHFTRLRATPVANPYNPQAPGLDWNNPDELMFAGALAHSSNTVTRDELDDTATTKAVLTTTSPGLDIREGDRIRAEPPDGHTWLVIGTPAQDINPFTGWSPSMEIQLEEVRG